LTRSPSELYIQRRDQGKQKLQFIRTLYSDPADILNNFDLGASMVLYVYIKNNRALFTTAYGGFNLANRVNIIESKRSTTTYQWRLNKYMKQKGFDVIAVGNHPGMAGFFDGEKGQRTKRLPPIVADIADLPFKKHRISTQGDPYQTQTNKTPYETKALDASAPFDLWLKEHQNKF
jgi:hypothetical protein